MPRYFFDVLDGGSFPDDEGKELADLSAVRLEAMNSLPEIARWLIPKDGNAQVYTVHVRDEAGAIVYTGTLMFAGVWPAQSLEGEPV